MDRKKLLLLLGALVVAIGTALAARSMFAGASAPQASAAPAEPQGPKVLVAKRALPVGTIITADAIGYQLWPQEMVQDAYFVDGEPVTQGSLVSPGDRGFLAAALGPGMRAVTVPVSEKTGVGGFVFPGDHIDLMLTQTINGAAGQPLNTTETILHNLRVLATDQSTETTTDDNGKTVVKAFRTVTLEATPKIAEKIEVAQTIGTLSLSLRSIADNQSDLDKAIASGKVDVSDNLSKDDEDDLLRNASQTNQDALSTFVTGGDVSRFQRKTMPPQTAPKDNGSDSSDKPVYSGPRVRVFRGTALSVEPVGNNLGKSAQNLVDTQAGAVGKAAGPVSTSLSTNVVG